MNERGSVPGSSPERWWAHLRHVPSPTDCQIAEGLWAAYPRVTRATRRHTVLDTLIDDPPELGVLDLPDEELNRRAEAFGVTEFSLGWLRAWGRRYPTLPERMLAVVFDTARHPDRARSVALDRVAALVTGHGPSVLADHGCMFAGRLDAAWLAQITASADACRELELPLDVLACQIPIRALGLREFAVDVGATRIELATLLTAAGSYEQFRAALLTERFVPARPVVSLVADAAPERQLATA